MYLYLGKKITQNCGRHFSKTAQSKRKPKSENSPNLVTLTIPTKRLLKSGLDIVFLSKVAIFALRASVYKTRPKIGQLFQQKNVLINVDKKRI
jgi:hypothetical protein